MILAFLIWSMVALLFLGIGISGWRSKKAVGFFSFIEPPMVTDVKKYNHSVSMLWIVGAGILELLGVPFLFLKQNSPAFILETFGVVVLVIGMIFMYIKIEARYKI